MITLRFAGYSDDTFGEETPRGDDYDNCASGKPIEWVVESPRGEKLLVVGQYCPGHATGWLVGVAPFDEDHEKPLPNWSITMQRGERPYSPMLCIDVPDGTIIRCLQREEGA